MNKQLELFPRTKKEVSEKQINKDPFKKIQDNLVEALNTYEDGENVVVNNGQIMMESEVGKQLEKQPIVKQVIQNSPKKLNDIEIYEILKKTASPEELKEFPDEIQKAKNLALLKSNKTYAEIAGKGASPKQVGQLAERLETYRQMTGTAENGITKIKKPIKKNNLVHNIVEIKPIISEPRSVAPEPKLEFNLEKYIAEKSQERLKKQQRDYDLKYGKFGLAGLGRPT